MLVWVQMGAGDPVRNQGLADMRDAADNPPEGGIGMRGNEENETGRPRGEGRYERQERGCMSRVSPFNRVIIARAPA